MVQVLRFDEHVADAEEAFLELPEVDAAAQVTELHGEVRVLHLPRHRFLEVVLEADRGVDVQLGAGDEGRHEERKALDVVPVRVPDEEMQLERLLLGLHEMQTELANAGAAIEDDERPARRPDFDAGSIAAVFRGKGPGRSDRATGSPETYFHATPLSPELGGGWYIVWG